MAVCAGGSGVACWLAQAPAALQTDFPAAHPLSRVSSCLLREGAPRASPSGTASTPSGVSPCGLPGQEPGSGHTLRWRAGILRTSCPTRAAPQGDQAVCADRETRAGCDQGVCPNPDAASDLRKFRAHCLIARARSDQGLCTAPDRLLPPTGKGPVRASVACMLWWPSGRLGSWYPSTCGDCGFGPGTVQLTKICGLP
jgi:hypothetical protein